MCLHSWSHQGPHDPSNGTIFTLNPHWGRVATGETKSLASMHVGVTSVVSNSLQPCGLWSTRLLCHWGFPGKNTGVYSPILVAIPFQRTIFPAGKVWQPLVCFLFLESVSVLFVHLFLALPTSSARKPLNK